MTATAMNESNNTTRDRAAPTLMHVVGLLFLAGWVGVARALGEGRRTAADTLRVLRDWYADYETLTTSDAACVEALEAMVEEANAACAAPADALVPNEPTARDAVTGMLLRHDFPRSADRLARQGWAPGDLAAEMRHPSPDANRAACIAALEALAVDGGPGNSIAFLFGVVGQRARELDEARAEAAALRAANADLAERLDISRKDVSTLRQQVATSVTVRGVCASCGCANRDDAPSWCVCRALVEPEIVKSEEAKMGKLDGVLSEASKRVAAWPDWKRSDDVKRRQAAFDARVEAMGAKTHAGEVIGDETTEAERLRTERAIEKMTAPCVVQVSTSEIDRLVNEAREAGRAEMRAEVEQVRAYVGARDGEALIAAIKRVGDETADIAATRTAQERDTAYQRGQEDMLTRIRRLVTQTINAYESSGGIFAASPLRDLGAELSRVAVAKTPTVSASEVTGEVDPGGGGTETAGAGESVARENRAARMNLLICEAASALELRDDENIVDAAKRVAGELAGACAELSQWRKATRCSEPSLVQAYIVDANAAEKEAERAQGLVYQSEAEISEWRASTGCATPALAAEATRQTKAVVDALAAAGYTIDLCGSLESAAQRAMAFLGGLRAMVQEHGARVTEWRHATGCGTPHEARERIASLRSMLNGDAELFNQRLNEIESLRTQLAKARYERGQSDDALKAIEEALLSASVTPQGDESLADTVRRALENREMIAPKAERVARVGDMVNLRVNNGVNPCVVLHVWGDGSVNLRDLRDLDEVESRCRGDRIGEWRFRD